MFVIHVWYMIFKYMHEWRNFHAFTQAYLAHAQTNFPAARKCMIEIEPHSEEQ